MRNSHFRRLAAVAGVAAMVPGVLSAQLAGRFVVTPYVGFYAPTNEVAKIDVRSSELGARLSAKQQSSAAYGATASFWITDRFAFELGSAYTSSGLRASGAIDEPSGVTAGTATEKAHIWLGSAKMMVQLLPSISAYNVRLGFGPAIIARGGRAYDADADGQITGLTDLGAVVSLCSRIDLSRSVGIRVRAEDYVYQSKLGWHATNPAESFSFDTRTQHDVMLSAGLQLFLGR